MFMRQLLQCLVQSLLQFGDIRILPRIPSGGGFDEVGIVLHAGIHVIEAHCMPSATLFDKVDRHVNSDGMYPGVKARFTSKAAD
jgi:hypothetical protein